MGLFQSTFRAISVQFQCNFSAISVQFQCNFIAISVQFHCNFRAISGQFQGNSNAILMQLRWNNIGTVPAKVTVQYECGVSARSECTFRAHLIESKDCSFNAVSHVIFGKRNAGALDCFNTLKSTGEMYGASEQFQSGFHGTVSKSRQTRLNPRLMSTEFMIDGIDFLCFK